MALSSYDTPFGTLYVGLMQDFSERILYCPRCGGPFLCLGDKQTECDRCVDERRSMEAHV